jgi:hypothetical protein
MGGAANGHSEGSRVTLSCHGSNIAPTYRGEEPSNCDPLFLCVDMTCPRFQLFEYAGTGAEASDQSSSGFELGHVQVIT